MPTPQLKNISGAYNGLAHKIKFARNAYQASFMRPEVRAFAENAAGRGDRKTQAMRLFRVLRQSLNYVADHVGVEFTKSPWTMIEEIRERGFSGGDCDDQATLAYTLLNSIGIPAALRVGWYGKEDPQHIYIVALLNGQWVPFDTTLSEFGREHPAHRTKDFR